MLRAAVQVGSTRVRSRLNSRLSVAVSQQLVVSTSKSYASTARCNSIKGYAIAQFLQTGPHQRKKLSYRCITTPGAFLSSSVVAASAVSPTESLAEQQKQQHREASSTVTKTVTNTTRNVVVIGGTGAIGSELVSQLLQTPNTVVYSYVRRLNSEPSPNLIQILIDGDLDASFFERTWPTVPIQIAFSAFGTTRSDAGGVEQFKRIDYGFNAAFAASAKAHGVSQYHLVSSVDADKNSSAFYLKSKGELDAYVESLCFNHVAIYRPGILIRPSPRFIETLIVLPFSILPVSFMNSWFPRWKPINVATVATAMINDATMFSTPKYHIYNGSLSIEQQAAITAFTDVPRI